jgi:hypothetical protein
MDPNKQKLFHVGEWKVPAVIADWLWISVQTGEKKPFEPYIIPHQRPFYQPKGNNIIVDDAITKQASKSAKPFNDQPPEKEPQSEKRETRSRRAPSLAESGERNDQQPLQDGSPRSPEKPSRSPSPSKGRQPTPTPTAPVTKRSSLKNVPIPEMPAPLEMAISDLLRQKRAGSKALGPDKEAGPQRRRRLLGRANSNSSTLGAGNHPAQLQREVSRASSIDTMNEDGYGVVVDGIDSSRSSRANSFVGGPARATAGNHPDRPNAQQQPRDSRFDFMHGDPMFAEFSGRDAAGFAAEDDDNSPEMTQLGYEDPDAAAAREQILQHAERLKRGADVGGSLKGAASDKKRRESGRKTLVVGTLQDQEHAGWGSGRRTRSAKEGKR